MRQVGSHAAAGEDGLLQILGGDQGSLTWVQPKGRRGLIKRSGEHGMTTAETTKRIKTVRPHEESCPSFAGPFSQY